MLNGVRKLICAMLCVVTLAGCHTVTATISKKEHKVK